jgi:uncharacterized membrane protein YdjX (TVP38/TMEM64 family)
MTPGPTLERETTVDATQASSGRSSRARLALLLALFIVPLVVAKTTGLSEHVSVESVRALMSSMGAWGFLLFLVAFAVGELMHVPGLVFVGAAAIAYGQLLGVLAGYVGALVSVTASFVLVRAVGGQPLGSPRRPWMRKVLARLEQRPVRTVALLRLGLFMAPALNYGLAMTSVRLRDYVLGSALGLLVPIPLIVLLFDRLAAYFL